MLNVGDKIRVHPKTNSAERAVSSGLGRQVIVVEVTEKCDTLKNVPAARIAPLRDPHVGSPHARWIAQTSDQHFRVVAQ